MGAISLQAHFDGDKIILDEPHDLKPNAKLIVTVLPEEQANQPDDEREAWFRWAMEQFSRGYGEDEPEYPLTLIKKWNPEYDGR